MIKEIDGILYYVVFFFILYAYLSSTTTPVYKVHLQDTKTYGNLLWSACPWLIYAWCRVAGVRGGGWSVNIAKALKGAKARIHIEHPQSG